MTIEEKLERAIEDRDMLETDIALLQDQVRAISLDDNNRDDEIETLEIEIQQMENEAAYLDTVIEAYESGEDY